MVTANGWTLYEHPVFTSQVAKLEESVARLKAKDPDGYRRSADAKLLAAIDRLTRQVIPEDPGAKAFRQGATLGDRRKHWFRAKFGNGRYRLFYQYSSAARIIIYSWVNDDETLRTYGSRTDAYAVFKALLDKGTPPDRWEDLLNAVHPPGREPRASRRKGRTRTKR